MLGLLNLNKPAGATSRDVVNHVQRLVRPEKVGHAGTLDPLATGVLVLCIGQATRLIEYVQRMPKSYSATFLLGRRSDSEDTEGEVEELLAPPIPTRANIINALPQFLGQIQQRPPAFSAVKKGGQRAYNLARRGEAVELDERPVEIFELKLLAYEYPELRLDIVCGSGTYVRSLGRDLAHVLGTEAVMSALTRTAIGTFRLEEAVTPAELDAASLPTRLLPALSAVSYLPHLAVSATEVGRLANGLSIPAQRDESTIGPEVREAVAVNEREELVSVLCRDPKGDWRAEKNVGTSSH